MADTEERYSRRNAKKCAQVSEILMRHEKKAHTKKVGEILKKPEEDRTPDDKAILDSSPDVVKKVKKGAKAYQLTKERKLEVEDSQEGLQQKCIQLATAIQQARNVVLYTGAGISTSAAIPDYRGPNGVYTLMKKGVMPMCGHLVDSAPTFTHMCIVKMYQQGLINYVVSQNCDGLHLRSGLPRHAFSELHGNMYIEFCPTCEPLREYIRLFDTTERTALRRHKTSRKCYHCGADLKDSIVHFGEKGVLHSPHNWNEAAEAADTADIIVCLGSSLQVVKKYQCLWNMHKKKAQRPRLFVVNLQWTPKDNAAILKINGKCDDVMRMVAAQLGLNVSPYIKELDPIYCLATPLKSEEANTHKTKLLAIPPNFDSAKVQAHWNVSQIVTKLNQVTAHRTRKKLELADLEVMRESSSSATSPLTSSSNSSASSSPDVSLRNPFFPPKDDSDNAVFMEEGKGEQSQGGETEPEPMDMSPRKPPTGTPKRKYRSDPNSPSRYREAMKSDKLKQKCCVEVEVISERMLQSHGITADLSLLKDTGKTATEKSSFVQADDFEEMRLAYSGGTESEGSLTSSPVNHKTASGEEEKVLKTATTPPPSALNGTETKSEKTPVIPVIVKAAEAVEAVEAIEAETCTNGQTSVITALKVNNEIHDDAEMSDIKAGNNNELDRPTAMLNKEKDCESEEKKQTALDSGIQNTDNAEPREDVALVSRAVSSSSSTPSLSSSNSQSDSTQAVITTPSTGTIDINRDSAQVSTTVITTSGPTVTNSTTDEPSSVTTERSETMIEIVKISRPSEVVNSGKTEEDKNTSPTSFLQIVADSEGVTVNELNLNILPELTCDNPELSSNAVNDAAGDEEMLCGVFVSKQSAMGVPGHRDSPLSVDVEMTETVEQSLPIILSRLGPKHQQSSPGSDASSSSNSPSPTPFMGRRQCDIFGHTGDCKCSDELSLSELSTNYCFKTNKARRPYNRPYTVQTHKLTLEEITRNNLAAMKRAEEAKLEEAKKEREEADNPRKLLESLPQNLFPGVEILEPKTDEPTPVSLVMATEEELNNFISESLGAEPEDTQVAAQAEPQQRVVTEQLEQTLVEQHITIEHSEQQQHQPPPLPPDPETENACVVLMEQESVAAGLDVEDVAAAAAAMEVVVDGTISTEANEFRNIVIENLVPVGSKYIVADDGSIQVMHPDGKVIIYTTMDTEEGPVITATEVTEEAAEPNFLSPTTVDHMLTDSIQEEVVTTEQMPTLGAAAADTDSIMTQLGQFTAELQSVIMNHMNSGSSQNDGLCAKLAAVESIVPEETLEANITAIREANAANPPQCISDTSDQTTPGYKEYLNNVTRQPGQNGKKKPAARKRRSSTKPASSRQPPAKSRRLNSTGSTSDALAAAMNESGIIPSSMSPRYTPSPSVSAPLSVNVPHSSASLVPPAPPTEQQLAQVLEQQLPQVLQQPQLQYQQQQPQQKQELQQQQPQTPRQQQGPQQHPPAAPPQQQVPHSHLPKQQQQQHYQQQQPHPRHPHLSPPQQQQPHPRQPHLSPQQQQPAAPMAQPQSNVPRPVANNQQSTIAPSYAMEQLVSLIDQDGRLVEQELQKHTAQDIQQYALCLLRLPEQNKTEDVRRVVEIMHMHGFIPPGPGRPQPPAVHAGPPTRQPLPPTMLNNRPPIRLPNGELLPEDHMAAIPPPPPTSTPPPQLASPQQQHALGIPAPMMSPRMQKTPENSTDLSKNFPSIIGALQGPTKSGAPVSPVMSHSAHAHASPQQCVNMPHPPPPPPPPPQQQQQQPDMHTPPQSKRSPGAASQSTGYPGYMSCPPVTKPIFHSPPQNVPASSAAMVNFLDTVLKQAPPPAVLHHHHNSVPSAATGHARPPYPIPVAMMAPYKPPDPKPYVPPPSQLVSPRKNAPKPKRRKANTKPLADEDAQRQRIQSILDAHAALTCGPGDAKTVIATAPPMPFPIPSVSTSASQVQTHAPAPRNMKASAGSKQQQQVPAVPQPYLAMPPEYMQTAGPGVPAHRAAAATSTAISTAMSTAISAPSNSVASNRPPYAADYQPSISPQPAPQHQQPRGPSPQYLHTQPPPANTQQARLPLSTVQAAMSCGPAQMSTQAAQPHATMSPSQPYNAPSAQAPLPQHTAPMQSAAVHSAPPATGQQQQAATASTLPVPVMQQHASVSAAMSTAVSTYSASNKPGAASTSVVSNTGTVVSSMEAPQVPSSFSIPGLPAAYPYIPPAPASPEEALKQAEYYRYLAQGASSLPSAESSKYADFYKQMAAQASLLATLTPKTSLIGRPATPATKAKRRRRSKASAVTSSTTSTPSSSSSSRANYIGVQGVLAAVNAANAAPNTPHVMPPTAHAGPAVYPQPTSSHVAPAPHMVPAPSAHAPMPAPNIVTPSSVNHHTPHMLPPAAHAGAHSSSQPAPPHNGPSSSYQGMPALVSLAPPAHAAPLSTPKRSLSVPGAPSMEHSLLARQLSEPVDKQVRLDSLELARTPALTVPAPPSMPEQDQPLNLQANSSSSQPMNMQANPSSSQPMNPQANPTTTSQPMNLQANPIRSPAKAETVVERESNEAPVRIAPMMVVAPETASTQTAVNATRPQASGDAATAVATPMDVAVSCSSETSPRTLDHPAKDNSPASPVNAATEAAKNDVTPGLAPVPVTVQAARVESEGEALSMTERKQMYRAASFNASQPTSPATPPANAPTTSPVAGIMPGWFGKGLKTKKTGRSKKNK